MSRAGRSRTSDGEASEPLPLHLVRASARIVLRLVFRVRIQGVEHLPVEGPVLLVGNHTGFLDGPIVHIVLPRPSAFLVKSELYVGMLRPALDALRQIPVRRGTPDRQALRRGLAVLHSGGVLGVFPEGTRGSGALETIQHGVGYLALKSGAPIVPVVCLGTQEALPKGARVPRLRSRIDIVFGESFQVQVESDTRSRKAVADAAEQIRRHLRKHLLATTAATGHRLPASGIAEHSAPRESA
jgi:1-acyl-sn-glycerol-3-phosphate acyltransferase